MEIEIESPPAYIDLGPQGNKIFKSRSDEQSETGDAKDQVMQDGRGETRKRLGF